ncbi:MAG: hypothetical protein ACLQM8_24945 [Limisphaerales bacterium]
MAEQIEREDEDISTERLLAMAAKRGQVTTGAVVEALEADAVDVPGQAVGVGLDALDGGDDAADCLRYSVATKSRTVSQRKLRGL